MDRDDGGQQAADTELSSLPEGDDDIGDPVLREFGDLLHAHPGVDFHRHRVVAPNESEALPGRQPLAKRLEHEASETAPAPMPTVRKPSALERWMNGRDQTL